MLLLQRNQVWRGLLTGGVWKRKVDTLYKQHQLCHNWYSIAPTHLVSILTEWASYKHIYKAPFDQKDTKRYEETERQKKKDKSQKEREIN